MADLNIKARKITVELRVDHLVPEETTHLLLSAIRSCGDRASLGSTHLLVTFKHIEMTSAMFEHLLTVYDKYPAFRMEKAQHRRQLGVLGMLCGRKVVENNDLGHTIVFQYKDMVLPDEGSCLPDPMYIVHPKYVGPQQVI